MFWQSTGKLDPLLEGTRLPMLLKSPESLQNLLNADWHVDFIEVTQLFVSNAGVMGVVGITGAVVLAAVVLVVVELVVGVVGTVVLVVATVVLLAGVVVLVAGAVVLLAGAGAVALAGVLVAGAAGVVLVPVADPWRYLRVLEALPKLAKYLAHWLDCPAESAQTLN
jgi:hypothetical protein